MTETKKKTFDETVKEIREELNVLRVKLEGIDPTGKHDEQLGSLKAQLGDLINSDALTMDTDEYYSNYIASEYYDSSCGF